MISKALLLVIYVTYITSFGVSVGYKAYDTPDVRGLFAILSLVCLAFWKWNIYRIRCHVLPV